MSILLGAALAAAMASGQDYAQQRVAPRGGYTQSCSEAYVNRGRLYADCRDTRGRMRGTSIELNRCGGEEINNDNGLLVCGRFRGDYEDSQPGRPGGGWGPGNGGPGNGGPDWGAGAGRAPQGSYRQSCTDASVRGGRLFARCEGGGRDRRASSLDYSRCGRFDIANENGLLVCGPVRGQWEGEEGWGGGNGGGWGRSSITVYDDANFRGASREFTSEDRNLGRTPFNDRIKSMRVEGRWEVCTDAEFRGRCRIVEGDVRFLNGGFNDNISSLRPVRGGRY